MAENSVMNKVGLLDFFVPSLYKLCVQRPRLYFIFFFQLINYMINHCMTLSIAQKFEFVNF